MYITKVIDFIRILDNFHLMILVIFSLSILQVPQSITGQDFGYDGGLGPTHWAERYQNCEGKHQSPININLLTVKDIQLPSLEMIGFDEPVDVVHVTNNGHTVLVEVEHDPHPRVRGGPLDGDYVFVQLHFHWGDNDTLGSEDTINSRSFPMELHMVFYKSQYGSYAKALEHSDGLTVLAFFYELDRHRHPAYDDITLALGNVTDEHTSAVLNDAFSLVNILPYDLVRYFTYQGSLTTPPCSEVVIWIDFEQPIRLSHDQIDSFRALKSKHGKISHNFRPIQPIGDRKVYYNSDRYSYQQEIEPEAGSESESAAGAELPRRNTAATTAVRPVHLALPTLCCYIANLLRYDDY